MPGIFTEARTQVIVTRIHIDACLLDHRGGG
jgi:hypothetical protein